MNIPENLNQIPQSPTKQITKTENKIWEDRGKRVLSKWHADRLRILQDKDDFASFEKYIGRNCPKRE